MGNAAGSMELPHLKEIKTVSAPPVATVPQKQSAVPKLPMPPEEELEERFSAALVSDDVQQLTFHVSVNVEGKTRSQTIQRNKEFRICLKCARPQDKLIAVPGTQCHCGKIHKGSFILGLTAALGSVNSLLAGDDGKSQVLQFIKKCN